MSDNQGVQPDDLFGLIQGTAYQEVPGGEYAPGVTQGVDHLPGGPLNEGSSPVSPNVGQASGALPPPAGVTNQPQAAPPDQAPQGSPAPIQVDPALAGQMFETIQNQSRMFNEVLLREQQREQHTQQAAQQRLVAAARQQDLLFEQRIAELPPEAQEVQRANRRAYQLTQALNAERVKTQKFQQREQQQHQTSQESAKAQLAMMVVSDAGLPLTMSKYVMSAQSEEEMTELAAGLARDVGGQNHQPPTQHQQAPQQAMPPMQNPAFANAGSLAGTPPTAAPEPGSGDLMGLIQSTGYQVAPITG